jgi:hypothetical protein
MTMIRTRVSFTVVFPPYDFSICNSYLTNFVNTGQAKILNTSRMMVAVDSDQNAPTATPKNTRPPISAQRSVASAISAEAVGGIGAT